MEWLRRCLADAKTFLNSVPLASHVSVSNNCLLANFKFQITLPKAIVEEVSTS